MNKKAEHSKTSEMVQDSCMHADKRNYFVLSSQVKHSKHWDSLEATQRSCLNKEI